MNGRFDISGFARELIEMQSTMMRAGATAAEDRYQSALHALRKQFVAAENDPNARIPTLLTVAILNVLRHITDGESPYAERRAEPRCSPDAEMNTRGGQLEPGK